MCVWVNMIVRPGVVIKSLMNTRTKKALELLDSRAFFFVYCGSNIILLYQRIQQLLLRCY